MAFNFGGAPAAGAPPSTPAFGAAPLAPGGFGAAPATPAATGFGAPASANPVFGAAPAVAPAGGFGAPAAGFSFGGAAAAAPPSTSTFGAATPAPGLGVGAAAPVAPTAAVAPPAASTFGAAAPTTTPAAIPAAPAAGFSFGGGAATAATPVPGSAATAGGIFGNTTSETPSTGAPAATAGGFGFGGAASATAPGQQAAITAPLLQTQAAVFTVPDFETVFPYMQLLSKIRALQEATSGDNDDGTGSLEAAYASQELLQLLETKTVLSNPPAPTLTPANQSLRQQLHDNPNVQLRDRAARLTPQMLQEVFGIADDLHLSEHEALSLYAQVAQPATRQWLHDSIGVNGNGNDNDLLHNVTKAASALFFQQRRALLQSILLLSQCRLQHTLLKATDTLLQHNLIPNLVTLIINLTQLAAQVQQELDKQKLFHKQSAASAFGQASQQQSTEAKKRSLSTTTWLHHLYHERQVAAECLFYLMYSTQCTVDEIVALIDLVCQLSKDATNMDPVKDVPDAHHAVSPQQQQQQWGGPFTQALPPLREKAKWDWEMELVNQVWNTPQPYALQCTSVLVMALICSLDTKQQLLNRDMHQLQEEGNALFQNGLETLLQDVAPIHERLHGEAIQQWGDRKDVWGVLAAAYALSLRPVSSVVASPRATSKASPTSLKRTWKACLTAPSEHKSFSFVRLSLMPAISCTPASKNSVCDLPEFLLSVLSDFTSNYLDVVCASNAIPESRANWQKHEEERLTIQREERDQERSFHESYGGAYDETREPIPDHVNLLQRPDCIDDMVAVAIDLCSQGPPYAQVFWTRENYRADNGSMQTRSAPSRALQTLAMLQEKDSSLIPTYVSFLAALAIAEPNAVFDLLNSNDSAEEGGTSNNKMLNWKGLFSSLRWYVRKMSAGYAGEVKPATTQDTSGVPFSGYYYGADHYGADGPNTTTTGTSSKQQATTRLKELGEANQAIVLSHLAVITKVAANYATGRTLLATMNLSLEDGSSSSAVDEETGDSVLVVLFSLAIAPLTPQLRGAVLATLASLLRLDGTNAEEQVLIRDLARKGWDLLELSQAVPVYLLDQYQSKQQQGVAPAVVQAMAFPPSSISSAANNVDPKAWLPADPRYGIIFEMEHVESYLGHYPSTEGLLQLLTSLVIAAGCPSDLGQVTEPGRSERLRPGSTPYIEFVLYFVLPRALGSRKAHDKLPFKAGVDSSRLVARALEVVEAVLTRYSTPSSPGKAKPIADELKNHKKRLAAATSLLRLPELTNGIMLPPTESDMQTFFQDFDSRKNPAPDGGVSLPRAKSPGFTILADILSASDSELLRGLGLVLTQDGGCNGVYTVSGQRDFQYRMTWAVFGDTMPSVATAKHKNDSVQTFQKHSLLRPLLPPIDVAGDLKDSNDSVHWRAKSIRSSLRILAAAAAREQEFVNALSSVATIVPVLQFKAKMNMVQKKEVHLTSVREALTHSTSPRCFPSIAQYLSSISSDEVEDCDISGSALALLMYSFSEQSASNSLSALDAQSISGEMVFVRAVAERLSASSKRTGRKPDADIVRVILDLLKSELSPILLGFPHTAVDGLDAPGVVSTPHGWRENECFTVLLSRLGDDDFLTNPSSSAIASSCLEIIYNLISSTDDTRAGQRRAAHLEARMKAADFWNAGALKFLASRSSGIPLLASVINSGERPKGVENVLHAAAWFSNGLAVHCAKKMQLDSQDSLSRENQRLLSNLLDKDYHLLVNLLECLPLEAKILNVPKALRSLQHDVESCMHQMKGRQNAPGYMLIDAKELRQKMDQYSKDGSSDSAVEEGIAWALAWNDSVQWDCAAAHLSSSTANLIEVSLEFSNWTFDSGLLGSLYDSNQLSEVRERSLLILLDQTVDRLIGKTEQLTPMSTWMLKSASINMSNEVLLLVERLLSSTRDRSHFCHFVNRLGLATMSSLLPSGSSALVDDDERSIVLGTALSQLLAADSVEIHDSVQDVICAVAASFAGMSCRSVNLESHDDTERRKALVSMASRSILSSLIGSLDTINAGTNPIIATLVTSLSSSPTSKTNMDALMRVIPTLDDNVCQLLEMMASCEGGANLLVKAGVMKALSAAATNYNNIQNVQGCTFGSGPPTFLASNLTLVRVLLASDSLIKKERDGLQSGAQALLVSYAPVIEQVARSFPAHGNTWLEIVQTLASVVWTKDGSSDELVFGHSVEAKPTALCTGLDSLVSFVVGLTENLVEYPFPDRLQPMLPQGLCKQETTQVWWDTVERELVPITSKDDISLPNPPTGLASGWSKPAEGDKSKYGPWTEHKYERCLAAAQVSDASLTFLIERSCDSSAATVEIAIGSIARGLCRLSDSSRAMSQRLKDIAEFSKGSAMDLGAFDSLSQESVLAEKNLLAEICPLFQRSCEKLLMLGHKLFLRMKSANEESFHGLASIPTAEMRTFAQLVHLALQYTRLETEGISEFCSTLAKKLQGELKNIQKVD